MAVLGASVRNADGIVEYSNAFQGEEGARPILHQLAEKCVLRKTIQIMIEKPSAAFLSTPFLLATLKPNEEERQ